MDGADATEGRTHRCVIPSGAVRIIPEAVPIPVAGAAAPASPQVRIVQDGDVIQAIDVVCSCGQQIRLRCLY